MITNRNVQPGGKSGRVIAWLDRLDNWAHVIVAGFFILMTATVILHMGFIFWNQLSLIVPAKPITRSVDPVAELAKEAATISNIPGSPVAKNSDAESSDSGHSAGPVNKEVEAIKEATEIRSATDPFVRSSLELLSSILFAIILLELLRTIITYLQTHDTHALMQEFLVVGIISSVRKILLIGAEASLRQGSSHSDFLLEAGGVVIDIVGILLLIGGLVILKQNFGTRAMVEHEEV